MIRQVDSLRDRTDEVPTALVNIPVIRATVVTGRGADTVMLTTSLPTAFPLMKYENTLRCEAAAGYGAEWVLKTFGIVAEVIETGRV